MTYAILLWQVSPFIVFPFMGFLAGRNLARAIVERIAR